ncbi:hypothetical protein ES703_49748 [subsurface metagenome]
MNRLLKFVDKLSEWSFRVFAWLVVVLVFELFYEVVARYVFNAPTRWSYDLTYMLYGTFFAMGSAYALCKNRHIRIDVFYSRFSPRWQAITDTCLYLVLFLPAFAVLFVKGIGYAASSWAIHEASPAGAWAPPLYPIKTVFPAAMLLLLLQGMAQCIRSLRIAIRGK